MRGSKGKRPSIQWYYKDWLSDKKLQLSSPSTRGVWMNLLMYMIDCSLDEDDCEAGELADLNTRQIAQLGGCTEGEAETFVEEALRYKFCDISVTRHGYVTLMSRRLKRDKKATIKSRNRKRKQREKDRKTAGVTPMSQKSHVTSPYPYPSPTSKEVKKDPEKSASGGPLRKKVGKYFSSIKNTCDQISRIPQKSRKPFNPIQWVQHQCNSNMHPGAIDETLKGILKYWKTIRTTPWQYASSTIKTKTQNYNEKEAIAIHEHFKTMEIPELVNITEGLLIDMQDCVGGR